MNNQPTAATTTATHSKTDDIKAPTTIKRALTHLVTHSSTTRLEAEKSLIFYHAFPNTMSNGIRQHLSLEFTSTGEKAIGYNRPGATYCRYRLKENNTVEAKQVINQYQFKRCTAPFQWEGTA